MDKQVILDQVNQLLFLVIQIIILVAGYYLSKLKTNVVQYLEAHTGNNQRAVLDSLAKETFAFAETVYKDLQGPDKLSHALSFLVEKATKHGFNITPEEARSLIEKAWLESRKHLNTASKD